MILTAKKRIIKTIAFIEPRNERLHINNRSELPRPGSVLLATIMRDFGYEAKAYFQKPSELRANVLRPDMVCISTITSTAFIAYNLAIHYRSLGIPVVMSGPHVSELPNEAIQYCDYIIIGEGEKSLPLLVQALQGKYNLEEIPGLYWKIGITIHKNEPNILFENPETNLEPDWSLMELGKIRRWKRKERRYLRRIQEFIDPDEDSYEEDYPWDGWPIFA